MRTPRLMAVFAHPDDESIQMGGVMTALASWGAAAGANGKKLDITYRMAWYRGLKTTYYLRSLGATHMEKSATNTQEEVVEAPKVCSILDPDCEACQ